MVIRTGAYEIDRGRLIRWADLSGHLRSFHLNRMINDLITIGSTDFTAQELLEYMDIIPGQLLDDVATYNSVHHSCITIIYNKQKRDDLDEIDYKREEGF